MIAGQAQRLRNAHAYMRCSVGFGSSLSTGHLAPSLVISSPVTKQMWYIETYQRLNIASKLKR